MARTDAYAMDISPLSALNYERPRKRLASYVSLYDESTGKATGKKFYIDKAIRRGQQNLQDLAEHINAKIETLLISNSAGFASNPHKAAETPKIKVVLDTPFTMIASGPSSIVDTVKRNLPFAPYLQALADKAVDNLEHQTGSRTFNGLHLRVEADAAYMHEQMGGIAAVWGMYQEGMLLMGINNSEPLYVASGILSNVTAAGVVEEELLGNPWYQFCEERSSQVIVKEMLLSEEDLKPLGNEHKAAVDFLVLKASTRAVGCQASTFSIQLKWLRELEEAPLRPTFLIGDINDPSHSAKLQKIIQSGLLARSGFLYRASRKAVVFCEFYMRNWPVFAVFAALALVPAIVVLVVFLGVKRITSSSGVSVVDGTTSLLVYVGLQSGSDVAVASLWRPKQRASHVGCSLGSSAMAAVLPPRSRVMARGE